MAVFARSTYRRTAMVGAALVAGSVLTFAVTAPGSAAEGDAAFTPGTGSAIALVYKVNPLFGNLSFGITAGESVAGHQNTAATAQSKAVNLGVIGVTLAGEGCNGAAPTLPGDKQPQPVVVNSDDPGAAAGKTGDLGGAIKMSARATTKPFAEAITSVLPLGDASGVSIANGTSTATSGIAKDGTRQAHAFTTISEVNLFGGLITLKGLRWDALQETGATATSQGSFSLGSINVAGTLIPLPTDALDQLKSLKDVLNALGVTITAPATRVEKGIVFVDPMKIGIVPSAARDNLVSAVLGGVQSVRESFTAAIASIACGSDLNILGNNGKTAVTLVDLALASISGAGSLTVELGGVQATTSSISTFEGLGVVPTLPSIDLPSADLPSFGDTGGDLGNFPVDVGSTPAASSTGAATGTGDDPSSGHVTPIADVKGARGGALLGVGVGGLLLLLLTAEADRRKMRRAQREIPLEA
jgi:hypothetical protein